MKTEKWKTVIAMTMNKKDMILKRTINKEEIKELPKVYFEGRIIVIQTEAEAEKAVSYLQSQKVLGIDSETRPAFSKGQSYKVALLQISSEECCFLFRLNITGFTPDRKSVV